MNKAHAPEAVNGLFQQALQSQAAGRLAEAEQLYRKILTLDPGHAHSFHMMGLMAYDLRGYDIAEDMIRQALALQDKIFLFHNSLGNVLKAKNKFDDAAASYRKAIALKPDYADALNNLGTALAALGRPDDAMESYKKALAADPRHADTLTNMGVLLESRGRPDEAVVYYQRAIAIAPNLAEAHFNLGNAFKTQGLFDDAQNSYKRAIAIDPKHGNALNNLGTALDALGKTGEAIESYGRAIALRPDFAEAHFNLGNALRRLGQFDEAARHYRQAAAIRPHAAARHCLGAVMHTMGQYHDAEMHYKSALALEPGFADALNGLGITYATLGRFEQAVDCYERALAIKPDAIETLSNLGLVYKDYGRLEESIAYFRRALDIAPRSHVTFSNLLLAMVYASSVSPEELAATARQFDETIAAPLRRHRLLVRNADPERKLRIAYVSPDLRDHAVNYFLEPLLKRHDRDRFEIFAYSNTLREDTVTARLRQEFDQWRDIRFLDDDRAADLIEADAIDILIDVAGHTANNRLMTFARKPAPVQVTWLGYPATSGMTAMDYRITDRFTEPVGMTERLNVETLWRLPEMFCCYQPFANSPAAIDHPPFEDNGHITFGCFNNFAKVTDPVLESWGRIMAQIPDSRLLLEIAGIDITSFRTAVEERMQRLGLPLDRVTLQLRSRANQYVLYNKIDIALDPFPCSGGTTSMDTLWMGVPFVTLAGRHFVSRMGVSFLNNIGLPELIARDRDHYVDLAVALARDKARLKALRHNLRERMAASPLMNSESFTRAMEDAYRGMWREWCASVLDTH